MTLFPLKWKKKKKKKKKSLIGFNSYMHYFPDLLNNPNTWLDRQQTHHKLNNALIEYSLSKTDYWIIIKWAASSEFVSSSIPSWQILTADAQAFWGARDLAFCLRVPFDSLLVWASSGGSGETSRMRRLAWTFAARIDDTYQIRLPRPKLY